MLLTLIEDDSLPEIQDILLSRLNRSDVSACSTAHALWSLISCLRLHVKHGRAESKSAAWMDIVLITRLYT